MVGRRQTCRKEREGQRHGVLRTRGDARSDRRRNVRPRHGLCDRGAPGHAGGRRLPGLRCFHRGAGADSGGARKLHGGLSEVDPRRARPHRPAERPRSASHLVRRGTARLAARRKRSLCFSRDRAAERVVNRRGLRRAAQRAGRRNGDALACDTQLESRAALPSGHRLAPILRKAVDRAAGRVGVCDGAARRAALRRSDRLCGDAAQHARRLATRHGTLRSQVGPVARRLRLRAVRRLRRRARGSRGLRKRRPCLPAPSRRGVRDVRVAPFLRLPRAADAQRHDRFSRHRAPSIRRRPCRIRFLDRSGSSARVGRSRGSRVFPLLERQVPPSSRSHDAKLPSAAAHRSLVGLRGNESVPRRLALLPLWDSRSVAVSRIHRLGLCPDGL